MAEDPIQKAINFLLEQNAKVDARVGRLEDRMADMSEALIATMAAVERVSVTVREVDERLGARIAETDDRLNTLISVVEKHMSGNGHAPR